MSYVTEMLEFNKEFVANKKFETFSTTKHPGKKIAILSCMDARLTELLPAALNLKNGEAKIIKNAGALITHPFGSVIRSLLVAVYELDVEDILVIGHYDCGVQGLEASKIINKMNERNIVPSKLDSANCCGIDLNEWLKGFDSPADSVRETVNIIREHPLIPANVRVHGFVIDPTTGKLDEAD